MNTANRVPPGTPTGGRFAPTAGAEAEIELADDLPPFGHDHPWNQDLKGREELEREFAEQLAGTGWGVSDPRQLSRRVFEGIALYRGLPQEETDAAVEEAVERGDDALYRWDAGQVAHRIGAESRYTRPYCW